MNTWSFMVKSCRSQDYGFAVTRGEVDEPIGMFLWKMVKMGFILAFGLGAGFYMRVVFEAVNGLQDGMATLFISGGVGGKFAGAMTAFGALDAADQAADLLVKDLWAEVSWLRLDLLVALVIFAVGICVLMIVGAAVTLMAKMFMAFALAIGPAAILCLMFTPSSKFFDSWLSFAMASAVLSWFVFFALGLTLFITDQIALDIASKGAFMPGGSVSPMRAATASAVMYGLLALMLWQAPSLASALTGGPAMRAGAGMAVSYVLGHSGGMASRGPASAPVNQVSKGGGAAYSTGQVAGHAYQRAVNLGRASRGSSPT